MINLYQLHKNPKKLEKYKDYGHLITKLIEKEYSEYGPILHVIKRSPEYSYWYASRCLYSRWFEAEPIIMTSSWYSYVYARNVIKDRWKEAEDVIMKEPWHAYSYAYVIMKTRWIDAEPIIKTNDYAWENYCREFNI